MEGRALLPAHKGGGWRGAEWERGLWKGDSIQRPSGVLWSRRQRFEGARAESGGPAAEGGGWGVEDSCPGVRWPSHYVPQIGELCLAFPKGLGRQLCRGDPSPSPPPPQQLTHLSGRWLTGFWAVSGESLGLCDLWTLFSFGIQDSGWIPGSKLSFLLVFWRSQPCADTPLSGKLGDLACSVCSPSPVSGISSCPLSWAPR